MNHHSLQMRITQLREDIQWICGSACCDNPQTREDYEALLALEAASRDLGNALWWSLRAATDVNICSTNLLQSEDHEVETSDS
jgi:hypothetical protein